MTNDFDWEALKRKVSMTVEHTVSPAELQRIFKQRSELLAQRKTQTTHSTTVGEHLIFSLGEVKFAVPLGDVRSLVSPKWVTRIPGAPAYKSRVTHIGGRIVSLVDLANLLALDDHKTHVREDRCLLLESGGTRLGLLLDEIHGIEKVDESTLSPAGQTTLNIELIKGITKDLMLVLDGKATVKGLRDGDKSPKSSSRD